MKRLQNPEEAICSCSTELVFLKISQLCGSLFCSKFVGQAWNLIKKEIPVQVFSWDIDEISKNIYVIC